MISVHWGAHAARIDGSIFTISRTPLGLFRDEGRINAPTVDARRELYIKTFERLGAATVRTEKFSIL